MLLQCLLLVGDECLYQQLRAFELFQSGPKWLINRLTLGISSSIAFISRRSFFIARCFSFFVHLESVLSETEEINKPSPSDLRRDSQQSGSALNDVSESHVTLPRRAGQLTVGPLPEQLVYAAAAGLVSA